MARICAILAMYVNLSNWSKGQPLWNGHPLTSAEKSICLSLSQRAAENPEKLL